MSAPFRIRRPNLTITEESSGSQEELNSYLERLMKMIPSEVLSLYLVGSGVIPQTDRIVLVLWSVICLVGVVCIRVYGTADFQRKLPPQWKAVAISAIAFIIWIYSLGGPFAAYNLHIPYVGSLLVLVWTFFVPIFYKGSFN